MRDALPSLLILMLTGMLSACGNGDDASKEKLPSYGPDANKAINYDKAATAKEVAEEGRGSVSCPAPMKTLKVAGTPVDDILGVRPGMMFDEAANIVLCSDPLLVVMPSEALKYSVKTFGESIRNGFIARTAHSREAKEVYKYKTPEESAREMTQDIINKTRYGIRKEKPIVYDGFVEWFAGTIGMPGEEKVVGVQRFEVFAKDKNPPNSTLETALINKYGQPSSHIKGQVYSKIEWARNPAGETIKANQICDMGFDRLSGDCGLVIGATIDHLRENPALAKSILVTVTDQAKGIEMIANTSQRFIEKEEKRRQNQLDEATKNADAPKL